MSRKTGPDRVSVRWIVDQQVYKTIHAARLVLLDGKMPKGFWPKGVPSAEKVVDAVLVNPHEGWKLLRRAAGVWNRLEYLGQYGPKGNRFKRRKTPLTRAADNSTIIVSDGVERVEVPKHVLEGLRAAFRQEPSKVRGRNEAKERRRARAAESQPATALSVGNGSEPI